MAEPVVRRLTDLTPDDLREGETIRFLRGDGTYVDAVIGAVQEAEPSVWEIKPKWTTKPEEPIDSEVKIARIRAVLDDHDYPAGALYDIWEILDARP